MCIHIAKLTRISCYLHLLAKFPQRMDQISTIILALPGQASCYHCSSSAAKPLSLLPQVAKQSLSLVLGTGRAGLR
uniref:Uncharacterized protein n=1 Tax=Zea mays TaxID=4577 RepID=C0HGK0_MAIZE|nr:unknown [Zea mays]